MMAPHPQLVLAFHVLQERDDASQFRHNGRLKLRRNIVFDQTAQPLMGYVSNLHNSVCRNL